MTSRFNIAPLMQKLAYIKQASDGFNSSMPDDPTGDGTTDCKTGPQYAQYAKDLAAIETNPPNADTAPAHSMTEDKEQENSWSSYTLSSAGSKEQSAKGAYEDRPEDPGTSMPAEAGQEKFSAARNCSLEQNIEIFNKCAQSLMHTKQAYFNQYNAQIKEAAAVVQQVESLPVGIFTKMAAEEGASPEEVNEIAASEAIAQEDPELLEALAEASPEELAELADIAEQIEASEGAASPEIEATAAELADTEQKMASYSFTKAALDAGASTDEAADVAAVETLAQEDPQLLEALSEASPEDLAQLAQVAEQIEASEGGAGTEEEITPEELEAIEKQSFFAQGPTNQQLLASMTDGQLKQAAANLDRAIVAAENNALSDEEISQILEEDNVKTASSMSAEDLYNQASSEDLYNLMLQKKAEEEAAVYDSLPPEYQEALANASDEELEDLITLGEAAQNNPEVLNEVLAGEGASEEPTSDEALNELASAMEEEGITPELLEEASKQASFDPVQRNMACNIAQKVAAFIRSGKHVHGPAKTEKAAKARYLSHQYLNEILPK